MKKQKAKGITLIALVITIIVLLILAGVTILALTGDEGILTKTIDAKDANSKAEEEEQVKLAVADALTSGLGKLTTENLKEAIVTMFGEENKGKLTGEGPWNFKGNLKTYIIDEQGNLKVKPETEGKIKWSQNGTTITMTDETGKETKIEVGDAILNYDPDTDENGKSLRDKTVTSYGTDNGYSDQTFCFDIYAHAWYILGVDEANSQLLITSDDSVSRPTGVGNAFYLRGVNGYLNGKNELDKISKLFGEGKFADFEKTRSITVDDINRITGYNPECTGTGKPCFDGDLFQYGNEVTYSWDGDKVKYTSNIKSGTSNYTFFQYLNKNMEFIDLGKSESKTFKATIYRYLPYTLSNPFDDDDAPKIGKVQEGTKAYNLISGIGKYSPRI